MLRHDSDMTRSNAGILAKEKMRFYVLVPNKLQGCLEIPLVLGLEKLELGGPFLLSFFAFNREDPGEDVCIWVVVWFQCLLL